MAEATEAKLVMDDLGTLVDELHEARTKWYYVGLKLKVPVDVLDAIESESDDQAKMFLRVLKTALKRVEPLLTWKAVVEALRSRTVGLEQLAETIEAKYCPPAQAPETDCVPMKISILLTLEQKLQLLQGDEVEDKELVESLQRSFVKRYITNSQLSGASLAEVQENLQQLHQKKFLITESVLRWATETAIAVFSEAKESSQHDAADVSSPPEVSKPLFCKDTVYHASLCCQAVSSCTAGDYQQFFKNKELVPGHSFNAVTISRPRHDSNSLREQYLIAKQGESTYYIAFQSETDLREWPKKCTSFIQGIEDQSKRFPMRFIIELLNKRGSRIILTGFSLGGLLACAVTADVWNSAYIRTDLLQKSLVCVTFGQPHISLPGVLQAAREQPELASAIHTLHLYDDPFPRVLPLLNECCSELGPKEETAAITLKAPSMAKMPFQDPRTLKMLYLLCKILNPEKDEACLLNLKTLLRKILPHVPAKKVLLSEMSTAYHVVCEPPPVGLTMREMTQEEMQLYSRCPLKMEDVDLLQSDFYDKHGMAAYAKKVFRAFLEKSTTSEPAYKIPLSPKCVPPELPDLTPSLMSVQLHRHGNELAVVVEGSNLWFSYQIALQGMPRVPIPGRKSSGCEIQFNVKGNDSIALEDGKVKEVRVTLHSYFSKPMKVDVPLQHKEYRVTSRQRQLAVLTPSRLIELAYMSALLEQYPFSKSQPVSNKVEVIRAFIDKVVRVVPLESIGYAIGYSEYPLAVHCASTLLESEIKLPPSELMVEGLSQSVNFLGGGGVPPQVMALRRKQLVAKFDTLYKRSRDAPRYYRTYNTGKKCIMILTAQDLGTSVSMDYMFNEALQDVSCETVSSLSALQNRLCHDLHAENNPKVICGLSIEQLYFVGYKSEAKKSSSHFKSPLDVLRQGNEKLTALAGVCRVHTTSKNNSKMLDTVNEIRKRSLAICTALLGGFMEQQEIDIPLVKSRKDRSTAFSVLGPASVGVWALSSLKYADISPLLSQCHGDQLLVKIENYVKAIFEREATNEAESEQYAAKLQFIVQGLETTVTCNSQYVSYSLERQLVEVCRDRKIIDTPLDELIKKWGRLFEENILSLVALSHRPLIARWLKWTLMVHNLREKLAQYTAVGVVGLVNSGKSTLVNSLFKINIPVGTTEERRTTVPLMYNMDQRVEGLDVVDFPGVDDRDETIPDLAELLLFLAQIVIFVVEYKRAHTESAKKWLSKLQEANIPVLVCLTFTDKLYAEIAEQICGKDSEDYPPKAEMQRRLQRELEEIKKKLKLPPSHTVQFFCFGQEWRSIFRTIEGREKLHEVGIGSPQEVGEWLVEVFRKRFDQEELADRLETFLHQKP